MFADGRQMLQKQLAMSMVEMQGEVEWSWRRAFPHSNFKECGKAEFGRCKRTVGIERLHVDDKGCHGGVLGFEEDLGIGEARVESNEACTEECIQHALD